MIYQMGSGLMISILFAGFSLALALLLFLLFKLHKVTQFQAGQAELFNSRLDSKENDLAALTISAVGMDRKIELLEQRLSEVEEQLLEVSQHEQGDSSYHSAIRQAQDGASFDQLVDECNISREEADLIVRLYGSSDSGLVSEWSDKNRVDL
ncbi:MAG: hypothetical protein DRQ61_03390 [Gammaproteobacteria bacterium]|nr:MAG: hypothetical protein DRQ61_03390 [Gammaproteobacteria bacterium]